jgi:transcriptional regulator with XRE-family HTH domain
MTELLASKRVTPYEVSQKTHISQATFSRILSGKTSKLSIKNAEILAKYFNVNTEWLTSGIKPDAVSQTASQKQTVEIFNQSVPSTVASKKIPFYDVDAEAGSIQLSNMDAVSSPIEWIDAGDWFRDADSAMRVHGDSMSPEYKSGSIVVMREVHDIHLVIFGEDYMIQTSEYRTIKRLEPSKQKDCWLACSVNQEVWANGDLVGQLMYAPFDIRIKDVTKICRILGCVRRNESSRFVYAKNR